MYTVSNNNSAQVLTARRIKETLDSIIDEMANTVYAFVANPDKDFTRNRVLTFNKMIRIIISMGGNSLQKELFDFFKDTEHFATKSAFVQQREKICPEAFKYLLHQFNKSCADDKTYMGYYLYACDGTTVNVAKNPANKETFISTQETVGYNQYHVNALYDIINKIYVDAIVQGIHYMNEPQAAVNMVNSLNHRGKAILICDRNYAALNLIEYCNRKDGLDYLIRVRYNWITEIKNLPMEEFDKEIVFEIRTTQTKEDKLAYQCGVAKYISGKSPKGKNKSSQHWDFESPYRISIRVVRFKITEDTYETVITSLDKCSFSLEKIKELYGLRWNIETSFRDLKYTIGMVNFHARKDISIIQEIYASLIMYNFSERIASCVVIGQANGRKYIYQVNFAIAAYICRLFYRSRSVQYTNLLSDISRYIEPVRKGRANGRKLKRKPVVNFIYRVA